MNGSSDVVTKPSALRLYFDVLACIARADGRIAAEERSTILAAASACDLDDDVIASIEDRLDLGHHIDVDAVLTSATERMDESVLVEVLRDSFVLAGADGDIADAETAVMERLLKRAGFDESGCAVMLEWARVAAEHHVDGLRLVAELRSR